MTRLLRIEGEVELQHTLVNLILDQSGSMSDCLDSTISGFNEYVQTLIGKSDEKAKIMLSLTTFCAPDASQNKIETIFSMKEVSEVPALTKNNYVPTGLTPLLDAIGYTVEYIEKELLNEAKPKIVCVILTDGLENNSKKYSLSQIKELITAKESEGWTFVYLGANQNSWSVGAAMGVSLGNSANYTATLKGYHAAFQSLGQDTLCYHRSVKNVDDLAVQSFCKSSYTENDEDEKKRNDLMAEAKGGKVK